MHTSSDLRASGNGKERQVSYDKAKKEAAVCHCSQYVETSALSGYQVDRCLDTAVSFNSYQTHQVHAET